MMFVKDGTLFQILLEFVQQVTSLVYVDPVMLDLRLDRRIAVGRGGTN